MIGWHGRVLDLTELSAQTDKRLVESALDWAGQIRVEPNTHSSICKQALCDILLELNGRGLRG